ncbi:MAG: phosphatidylserine decarboxylase [Woeseiaceae bacterium]|nr:phosphatidylserine decarboxylase [Woeseiaceae bacterium]NIP22065.1 phosphatidylserine decarboxylase [Woeseiaceae bacterium]NIS91179.1 phosphatidylserine decarboxylase [Woeseiaceae bacterium]
MLARLFVLLQYVLPRYWLTSLIYRVARVRNVAVKDFLIRRFIKLYDVNIDEVKLEVPAGFETLNAFFIRELGDGVRPVDRKASAVVSPVDGIVSSAGKIDGNRIFQAKGLDYSLEDLLATDLQQARRFVDGAYATIYLAPYNYHRVHAPCDGRLTAAHYIPGDLFSVNTATAANVRGLFRRNERLALHFETDRGPWSLIFIGALNVGSISTPWSGEVRPRKSGVVETFYLDDAPRDVQKGDLLGWFNMGSTVILLTPARYCEWNDALVADATVQMGERIGTTTGS